MTLSFWVVVFLGLIYASFASMASSQYVAPAPAPAPTSDGKFSLRL